MLADLLETVPYRVHTVLTDNGIQFTHTPGTSTSSVHVFDRVCRANGIEHRLTRPNHPLGDPMIAVPAGTDRQLCCRWTNGQAERMNRTIKEATVRTFHYASADELKRRLDAFLLAYNHARRLKTLRAKPLTTSSATSGQSSQNASGSIPSITVRDRTATTTAGFAEEISVGSLRGQGSLFQSIVVACFGLCRWDVADGLEQTAVIETSRSTRGSPSACGTGCGSRDAGARGCTNG